MTDDKTLAELLKLTGQSVKMSVDSADEVYGLARANTMMTHLLLTELLKPDSSRAGRIKRLVDGLEDCIETPVRGKGKEAFQDTLVTFLSIVKWYGKHGSS